jgi:hypothetical protein
MGPTVSDLKPASLLAAARSVAGQLTEAGEQLPPAQRAMLPAAMARYVNDDLANIDRHH